MGKTLENFSGKGQYTGLGEDKFLHNLFGRSAPGEEIEKCVVK